MLLVPLSLPFPVLPSPPSPTTILLLSLPLEGKTKGLGEVTGIARGREGKSEKGRGGEREGKGDEKVRGHGKGGRLKRVSEEGKGEVGGWGD